MKKIPMKIYTKAGDKGSTRLANGNLVPKNELSIEAIGSVDELNAWLGLIVSGGVDSITFSIINKIQNELFSIGAELAGSKKVFAEIDGAISYMEERIDKLTEQLPPLKNFILPGGTAESSLLHLARTICRRVERRVVATACIEETNIKIITYLNRLSDLLFVLARYNNVLGREDVIWKSP